MRRSVVVCAIVAAAAMHAVLAFVVFPGAGFASDMAAFQGWAQGVYTHGPAAFYAHDPSANYPPVSILVLWGVAALSHVAAALTGQSGDAALVVLLKLPAVLADWLTALVVYALGRVWRGPRVGVTAASAFLVVPPVWYVSAVWGQIDSLLTLFSILALWLVVTGRQHLAAIAAVLAVLVKPQGILVVLVVGVVLLGSSLGRDRSGRRHPVRLLSTILAGAVALLLLVPFDYEHLAGPRTAAVPVVGDLAGFVHQSVETGALFPVLTANAYNPWALVGDPSLSASIGSATAIWHVDSTTVLGLPDWALGVAALAVVLAVVVVGLLVRRDLVGVLLGYTVLSYAFFVLPTRVHERYLVPVFASAAVLAAPHLIRLVLYLLAGLLQLVNLHAVLAAPLDVRVVRTAVPAPPSSRPPGGRGPVASPGDRPRDVSLPWADAARSEMVVQAVSVAQLVVLVGLLVTWFWVLATTRDRTDEEVRRVT